MEDSDDSCSNPLPGSASCITANRRAELLPAGHRKAMRRLVDRTQDFFLSEPLHSHFQIFSWGDKPVIIRIEEPADSVPPLGLTSLESRGHCVGSSGSRIYFLNSMKPIMVNPAGSFLPETPGWYEFRILPP